MGTHNDLTPIKSRIVGYDTKPADQFNAHPHNWRKHPQRQREAVAASLRELGWIAPVIENRQTGNLIDGHERVWQALQRGEDVPYMVVDLSPEEEALALATFDAITGMAETDAEALDRLLAEVSTGEAALMELIAETAAEAGLFLDKLEEADAEPQVSRADELQQEWQTETGQLWRLPSRTAGQEHRLICGDCTDADVVARVMGGQQVKMVITDPPYGVNYSGGMATPKSKRETLVGDMDASLYKAFLLSTLGHIDPKAPLYLWYADKQTVEVFGALLQAGYQSRCTIIWNKNQAQFGAISAQYKAKHEPMLYCFRLGNSPYWYGPNNESTVWDAPRNNVNEYHPTEKPVSVFERAITNSSRDGDLVADFFSGSGTTIIAAENLSRQCRAVEISPAYVAVALQRYQDAFGITPELVE